MKKLFLVPVVSLCQLAAQAQSTVTYKPGPTVGEDTHIMTTYGCGTYSPSGTAEGLNWGSNYEMQFSDWTYNSNVGCPRGTIRSLIRFTELNSLPPTAQIINAQLNLFGPSGSTNYGNSSFPGSPYGTTNEGWVRRVTSGWGENSVTWNTQPSTTTANQAAVAVTGAHWNWNTSIDVTDLVRDIRSSCQNDGFELLLQNETHYRQQLYATSDNDDNTLWPELQLTYCDPGFTYCSSPLCPYGFTFQPNDATAPYIQWMVDGNVVYDGPSMPMTYNFPGPGTYKICLLVKGEKSSCDYCMTICVAENERRNDCKNCEPGVVKSDGHDPKDQMRQAPAPQGGVIKGDDVFLRVSAVSPNPTRAGWAVTVQTASSTDKSDVVVYDMNGREVVRQSTPLTVGANTVTVDARKLPAGSYILRVTTGGVSSESTTVVKY